MNEWQLIATAPRGQKILVSNGVTVAEGEWLEQLPFIRESRDADGHYIDQQEFDGFTGFIDYSGGMLPEPTHWMPMPEAPGELANTQGRRSVSDRDVFEDWCRSHGRTLILEHGPAGYSLRETRIAWAAFQQGVFRGRLTCDGRTLDAATNHPLNIK